MGDRESFTASAGAFAKEQSCPLISACPIHAVLPPHAQSGSSKAEPNAAR